jgi:flagellar motor component MotA
MRFLGIAIILVIIVVLMKLADGFLMYMDLPSLLLVFGIAVGAIIARHGFIGLSQVWQKEGNEAVLHTLSNAALIAGLIGTSLAMVALLSHSEAKHIGPSVAVSLLSSLYGIILYAVCYLLNPKFEVSVSTAVLMLANILVAVISFAIGMGLAVSNMG